MNERKFIVLIVVYVFLSTAVAQANTEKAQDTWNRDYWVIHLTLDMPKLDPHAVQYAFFDYDPIPDFTERVKGYSKIHNVLIERYQTEEKKQSFRKRRMKTNWDEVFVDVTGDKVYMLSEERSISSNAPSGKQWVVTKVTYLNGEPICWCIPVQPEIGKETNVVLNRNNTFNVAEVFDIAFATGLEKKETQYPADINFKDEAKARALYDRMIKALHDARTLYYESTYWSGLEGVEPRKATYRIWMKKPNHVRLEASRKNKVTGTLVGDGDYFWIYWGNKKVDFNGESFQSYSNKTYMKIPSPEGHHSIAHMTSRLEAGMGMTILQPSRFHGGGSSLDEYFDGIRSVGSETVNGEKYDIIEVSYMNNQRSKYFWLSKRDYLPRKLMEIVRVKNTILIKELWSNIFVNVEIPDALFSWQPPAGWTEYKEQDIEERLLESGTVAPDFEFKTIDGNTIKLSDFHGKVVLINFWRVGCPPCRCEIPHLERLYRKYKEQGLIVIGFNSYDDHDIALDLLRENSVTYSNIVDASEAAWSVQQELYQPGTSGSAVPMNYIIDRYGKVADAWYGFDKKDEEFLDRKLEPFGFK